MMKNQILANFKKGLLKNNFLIITKRHFGCMYDLVKLGIGGLIMDFAGVKQEEIQKFNNKFKNINCYVHDLELNNMEIFYVFILRLFIFGLYYLTIIMTLISPWIILFWLVGSTDDCH